MGQLTDAQRIRHEFTWVNAAMEQHADPSLRTLWEGLRHGSKMFVYPGKVLVAWRWFLGAPQVVARYRVGLPDITPETGLRIALESRERPILLVTHVPVRLHGLDVFVWSPAFNDVRFTPRDWFKPDSARTLRFGLNFKQTKNLADGPEEGVDYFSELSDFRRLFPNAE